MEDSALENRVTRPIMVGLLLVTDLLITACGGGDSGPGLPPEIQQDYVMWECGKVYRWNGLWWEWECPNSQWNVGRTSPYSQV